MCNDYDSFVINSISVEHIEEAAETNGTKYWYLNNPLPWSEDFAYFTRKFPGALFGLDSGESQSQLHNPDYDFPDEIIEDVIKMYNEIFHRVVKFP